MDEAYIMCDDEKTKSVTVDVHCRRLSPCWPNPLYSIYYRKLLGAYGLGPIFLWERERIVGFLPLSVLNCAVPELPLCVHYTGGDDYGSERHIDLAMVESAEPLPFAQLQMKEIRIGCMTLHPAMRGRGFAVSMVAYLIDRARDRGWERVRARAMLDGEPHAFYPTLSWWKALGFTPIGEVRSFGPSNNPIDRSRAVDLIVDLAQ